MIECVFELNNQPMSALKVNSLTLPAFSGRERDINRYEAACRVGFGPITPGTYFIVDRPVGGRLGWLREHNPFSTNRAEWFALFADDGQVNDISTLCGRIERGEFRLHPKGPMGRSDGCVVIDSMNDFQRLRALLLGTTRGYVPGTKIACYGKLVVRKSVS